MSLIEIYNAAGLTEDNRSRMPSYIEGEDEFYGSEAYDKLYEYFAFEACEMPYGTAKARDGDPDSWILDYLEAYASNLLTTHSSKGEKMSTLTLYCSSRNDETRTDGRGTTGAWRIGKDRLEKNLGETVLLYSGPGQTAYRGGTIVGYEKSQGSYKTDRYDVIFEDDPNTVGDSRTAFKRAKGASNPVIWL